MKIRFKFSSLLIAMAFFLLVSQMSSQEITHETPATSEQLDAWLHSGNPRLVAWAATLARERKEIALISRLPEWLRQSSVVRDEYYSPGREDRRAYDAVLDALIRGDNQLSVAPEVLQPLGRTYPIQAFMLLNRLPAAQQLPVLKEWFSPGRLGPERSGLAHLAAMQLAQWPTPVPGFAARILADTEERFNVDLRDTANSGNSFGVGGACGDSVYQPPVTGWPEVYQPLVEEAGPTGSGTTLIKLDGDRVSYYWVRENSPGGSCFYLRGLDQRSLHAIVAHWLGQAHGSVDWRPVKTVAMKWTNRHAFESSLGRLVEHEEEGFAVIAKHLVESGQLSQEEAAWARPKLIVRVVCHVEPCPIQGASKEYEPWSPAFSF